MMKKGPFLGMTLALAGSLATAAQQPVVSPAAPAASMAPTAAPRPHSLSLEVTTEKQGGTAHNASEKEALHMGRQIVTSSNQLSSSRAESLTITTDKATLQVAVRNLGQLPDTVEVQCYFFGERLGVLPPKGDDYYVENASRQFIFDHPTQPVTVAAGATNTIEVGSTEVRTLLHKLSTGGYAGSGSADEAGTRLRGWLVRLVAEGKVLAVRGSSNTFEDLGKDEAKLNAYLALVPPREPGNRRTVGPFRPGR